MRNIEIDFEVHQLIELERRNFDETPNDALRRLLKLPDQKREVIVPPARLFHGPEPRRPEPRIRPEPPEGKRVLPNIGDGAWTGDGVALPNGTQVRMHYNDRWHFGEIQASQWVVEGKVYTSPSSAAVGCAVTKDGTHPSLNGWLYWEFIRPGEYRAGWQHLSTARDHAEFGKNGIRPATLDELRAR